MKNITFIGFAALTDALFALIEAVLGIAPGDIIVDRRYASRAGAGIFDSPADVLRKIIADAPNLPETAAITGFGDIVIVGPGVSGAEREELKLAAGGPGVLQSILFLEPDGSFECPFDSKGGTIKYGKDRPYAS